MVLNLLNVKLPFSTPFFLVEGGYLQQLQALWIWAARGAPRPRRPVRPPLGNCCSASPTCGGSAWPPRAPPPDPGPAAPGEPSAAGFQTVEGQRGRSEVARLAFRTI